MPLNLEDLYRIAQATNGTIWVNGIDQPILLPPHICKCNACKGEINVLEEAYLDYGGAWHLKEECLTECHAIRGIRLKEEVEVENDRDD